MQRKLAFLFLHFFFFTVFLSKEHNKETKSQTHWLKSFSNSAVVNLLSHKKSSSKALNSGFWKAKSGKTSLADRTAHSKSVQICSVLCICEKVLVQCPQNSSLLSEIFWQKKKLNFAFQGNFEFWWLFLSPHSFKIVTQFKFSF